MTPDIVTRIPLGQDLELHVVYVDVPCWTPFVELRRYVPSLDTYERQERWWVIEGDTLDALVDGLREAQQRMRSEA